MHGKRKKGEKAASIANLPEIPGKKYFTIGEAAELCGLKPYVLRFWENEFPSLKPVKRRNRRYYQKKDLILIRQISSLLYEKGFTIQGAKTQLVRPGRKPGSKNKPKTNQSSVLKETLDGLDTILTELSDSAVVPQQREEEPA